MAPLPSVVLTLEPEAADKWHLVSCWGTLGPLCHVVVPRDLVPGGRSPILVAERTASWETRCHGHCDSVTPGLHSKSLLPNGNRSLTPKPVVKDCQRLTDTALAPSPPIALRCGAQSPLFCLCGCSPSDRTARSLQFPGTEQGCPSELSPL